jgi:hypothetical protein
MKHLVNVGPLLIGMKVIDSFYSYSTGIYQDASCGTDINHAGNLF